MIMDQETRKYLDEKFSGIDKRFDTVEKRFEGLESDVADLGSAITALATHIDERFDEIVPVVAQVSNHESRIKFLENKLPKLAVN